MTQKKIISALKRISKEKNLRGYVAQSVLMHNEEDIEDFISDVLHHGCVSGTVAGLIYYKDTHELFDRHYQEIERLRFDYEEELGEQIKIDGDLKNFLAWFAYERTLDRITQELGLQF